MGKAAFKQRKATLRLIYITSLCCTCRNQKRDCEEIEEIVAFPSILFQQVLFMGGMKLPFNYKALLQLETTAPSETK